MALLLGIDEARRCQVLVCIKRADVLIDELDECKLGAIGVKVQKYFLAVSLYAESSRSSEKI